MSDIIGPGDGTKVPRFAGESTFARLPRIDQVSKYDVAVLDLGLPDLDGRDVFRLMRARWKSPIIMTSAPKARLIARRSWLMPLGITTSIR